MDISVINVKGEEVEKLTLDPLVFDNKINNTIVHQAVVTYLANQRKGTASTKTRGEVRGGGKKPWRQKGSGRARAGSKRSPLSPGGGITFGPKPHSFHKDFPKKMKSIALKSVLNAKLKDNELIVLDDLKLTSYKTKEFYNILKDLKLNGHKVRFVMEDLEKNLALSSRNIENVRVSIARNLNTYDAINCKKIIFTKNALKNLEDRIKKYLSSADEQRV